MSLDFNDIVKQGEVKIKSRTIGVWQKRWIIFRKNSSSGPRRLERYPDEKCAETGQQMKVISLEKVHTIHRPVTDARRCVVEVLVEEGAPRVLMFNTESEADDWEQAMRYECMESPVSRHAIDGPVTQGVNNELFYVHLLPSMSLALSGECLLQVTSEHLILLDVNKPKTELVSWPLNCLRRYGGDDSKFTFESGRHCAIGEGLFIFNTVQGDKIYQKVHSATTAICEAVRLLQRQQEVEGKGGKSWSAPSTPKGVTPSGAKMRVGQTTSLPLSDTKDGPPLPPPRPASHDRVTAQRSTSLPGKVSPKYTDKDRENNNIPARDGQLKSPGATACSPTLEEEGDMDVEDAEKYLDPKFREFLNSRKRDSQNGDKKS